MIADRTIVCFASGWSYHPTSKHHIMRQLAERNQVIWVNWHASRRPGIGLDDLRTIGAKLLQIRRGAEQVSPRIIAITPPQLPLPGSRIARRINVAMVRRAVRRVLATLPPRPVQVWSFAPDAGDMVGSFDEELVLYYCVDAFGEFPGYDRELIDRRERELIARSDVVLATSRPLYDAKRVLHANTHLLEHGVDYRHLSRAVNQKPPMPLDLQELPRPVIGFVGVVGEWVDLGLLAGVARQMPDASIVVIGPHVASRSALAGLPNVHWLGPKDHSVLPDYLAVFDVGLIPFRKVPLTHHANPIKLYEYLAAGAPVVSTSLPAVRAVPGSVWLADDVATTVRCCREALQVNRAEDRRRRSEATAIHDWPARLERISEIIDHTMADRGWSPESAPASTAAPVNGALQPA